MDLCLISVSRGAVGSGTRRMAYGRRSATVTTRMDVTALQRYQEVSLFSSSLHSWPYWHTSGNNTALCGQQNRTIQGQGTMPKFRKRVLKIVNWASICSKRNVLYLDSYHMHLLIQRRYRLNLSESIQLFA